MIEVVLCDRSANGIKHPTKRTSYRCPTGKDAAIVVEQVTLCGARNAAEFEAMREHLYDPEIGGRTLLELPTVMVRDAKTGELKEKRVALHEQFAT